MRGGRDLVVAAAAVDVAEVTAGDECMSEPGRGLFLPKKLWLPSALLLAPLIGLVVLMLLLLLLLVVAVVEDTYMYAGIVLCWFSVSETCRDDVKYPSCHRHRYRYILPVHVHVMCR